MIGADRTATCQAFAAHYAGHSAHKNLADLHRECPKPPEAPLIKTFCPDWIFPVAQRPAAP